MLFVRDTIRLIQMFIQLRIVLHSHQFNFSRLHFPYLFSSRYWHLLCIAQKHLFGSTNGLELLFLIAVFSQLPFQLFLWVVHLIRFLVLFMLGDCMMMLLKVLTS
jgi:hypothetical protein